MHETRISIGRWLTPAHKSKGHLVSRFVMVPVTIPFRHISGLRDDKERLIATMKLVKEQYSEYLSNPCTPHLMSEQMRLMPPTNGVQFPNVYSPGVTNIGDVDKLLPSLWPLDSTSARAGPGEQPIIRLTDLHFGHRITVQTP